MKVKTDDHRSKFSNLSFRPYYSNNKLLGFLIPVGHPFIIHGLCTTVNGFTIYVSS